LGLGFNLLGDKATLQFLTAILIIKIVFLKARRWRAFKKTIWVFPVPSALETPKSSS
jgi:hypothetical protein